MPSKYFRNIAKTGTAETMEKAANLGYTPSSQNWVNFGQGSPELGFIENDLPRVISLDMGQTAGYAPVSGLKELRQKIADYYNFLYRKNHSSKYSFQNVSITSGGRNAVCRILSALNKIKLGFLNPDYTGYEEVFRALTAAKCVEVELSEKDGFKISTEQILQAVEQNKLDAMFFSNPCNPTGQVLFGKELEKLVKKFISEQKLLILDEFYSRYFYSTKPEKDALQTISSARFVENVNNDQVLIIDGFTKGWRYPGWRLSWILGPSELIEEIDSVGSFLDGGACHPLQKAGLGLLTTKTLNQNILSLQTTFRQKRDLLIEQLPKLGLQIKSVPQGAFYIFVDTSNLPESLNTGQKFTNRALEEKLIVIAGNSFDINPMRPIDQKKFQTFIRLSFGPEISEVQKGIARIAKLVNKFT